MKSVLRGLVLSSAMLVAVAPAFADKYDDAIAAFKEAGKSGAYFSNSYGYAVFPTVGKGGLGVGAAHGTGRVYWNGTYVGNATLNQVSVGFQAGGQAYSEIIFFKDEDAFKQFTSGHFQLGADVGAVAITASAGVSANTGSGANATVSGTEHDAATAGGYHNGLAVFTLAKGGAMYEAAVAGQKFSYKPVKVASR